MFDRSKVKLKRDSQKPAKAKKLSVMPRLHAIDGIRVMVMLMVVALHACIPYMTVSFPNLIWSVQDSATHPVFSNFFIWVRGCTMPLFFFIGGFWTVRHYEVMGEKGFIAFRKKRILIPLICGLAVILPTTYYIWSYGWYLTGRCFLSEILLGKFSPKIMMNLHGPLHLWFLEYLILLSLGFIVLKRYLKRRKFLTKWNAVLKSQEAKLVLFSSLRPLFFALPTAVIFYYGLTDQFDFHNTFIPNPMKLAHYAIFFSIGAWAYEFKEDFIDFKKHFWLYILATIPLFYLILEPIKQLLLGPLDAQAHFQLAIMYALFNWFLTFGFLGLFLTFFNHASKVVRYLSDASYWVYLVHFTLIGTIQLLLYFWDIPVGAKFGLAFSIALAVSLLSYQWIARHTFIGAALHKPGYLKKGESVSPQVPKYFKRALAAVVLLLVFFGYEVHQRLYAAEEKRYTPIVAGYYREYLGREPDDEGLRYWVNRALDHEGLEEVKRVGFIEAKKKGAQ